MISRHWRALTITILFVLAVLVLPVLIGVRLPIEFNQFLLQRLQAGKVPNSRTVTWQTFLSTYSAGWNVLRGRGIKMVPDLKDEKAMFAYVWSWVPPRAYIYPTEGFYYFSTKLSDGGEIAGNIRLADVFLGHNKISTAYFPVIDTAMSREVSYATEISETDGLISKKVSDNVYDVTYQGKTVRFTIPWLGNTQTKIALLPGEELIGHLFDESGTILLALYNKQTNSFYELLDQETGVLERLVELDKDHVIGERTGFIYFVDQDTGRKVLVGVDLNNVEANNYLDGPGDQFPFWVNLKEKLNRAYPNTMLGDGVDEHGVYLNKPEWVRIAISPYIRYSEPGEVVEHSAGCAEKQDKNIFYTCLTKEWWNTAGWRQGIFTQLKQEGKYESAEKSGLIIK
jgi:hypothetical protein